MEAFDGLHPHRQAVVEDGAELAWEEPNDHVLVRGLGCNVMHLSTMETMKNFDVSQTGLLSLLFK